LKSEILCRGRKCHAMKQPEVEDSKVDSTHRRSILAFSSHRIPALFRQPFQEANSTNRQAMYDGDTGF